MISFGGIEWEAIACEQGCTLLLACEPVCLRAFHDRKRCPEWNKSAIRAYLNGEFLDRFSPSERACIQPALVVNGASTRRTGNASDTVDSVFLLSAGEARSIDPELRKAGCRWWLRTPGADSYYIAHVEPRGAVSSFGSTAISDNVGVRPALWVRLDGVGLPADGARLPASASDALPAGRVEAAGGASPESATATGVSTTEPSAFAFGALDATTKLRVEADYLASLSDGLRPLNPLFHDHAARQSKKLLELALSRRDSGDILTGMIREGLVTARNIDQILEKVTQLGDVDLMAMLLDFKSRSLSAEDLEREERRRENEALRLFNPWSVEELKKVWKFTRTDEGAVITAYSGQGPIVAVPETIGRLPVVGLNCDFPREAAHLLLPDILAPTCAFEGTVHASQRFAQANADWLESCGGFQPLDFGEGCTPEAYIPAAQMRQGQIRMMDARRQIETYGCAVLGKHAWMPVRDGQRAMLLVSRDIVARKPYNQSQADAQWDACTLRLWLNSEFMDGFTIRDKQQMLKIPVHMLSSSREDESLEQVLERVDGWLESAEDPSTGLSGDAVFLLSSREAKELLSVEERRASAGWWLRDAGIGPKSACYMQSSGRLFDLGGYVSSPRMGVRPVIIVAKPEE